MKFLLNVILFFTPYVNLFEWKVDRFFRSVKSTDSIYSIKFDLLSLMKQNLMMVNVWMERKYKGYKYLKKSNRRKMYRDSLEIVRKLNNEIDLHGLAETEWGNDEKLRFLASIMRFLAPGKYYKYIKTASFGKLLRNPGKETLEGDCNQIVTLYIYLYSTRYPVDDLQIKLLPEHVCLHYNGIDIEATNATFQKYTKFDYLLPVTEIITTNLLDIADFRENLDFVSPRVFVKSAQLSYAISSLKSIVDKNLQIAYQNLAIDSMKKGDFNSALFFSSKMNDKGLYAKVRNNQAVSYYKKDQFEKALKIFVELSDKQMQKACYGGMYNVLANKVKNVKTLKQLNEKRKIFEKMLDLALKMEDEHLISSVRGILKN